MLLHPAELIVDTREQRPYTFAARQSQYVDFHIRRDTLREGDYATRLAGESPTPDTTCIVERKSLGDLLSSVTHGRDRFEAELERLRPYSFKALVVEGTLDDLATNAAGSRASPSSIIGSLIAFQTRYDVHLMLCGTRQLAEAYVWRLFERWIRDRAAYRNSAQSLRAEGKTQEQVAELLGVCQKTIDKWELTTISTGTNGCIPDVRLKIPMEATSDAQ